jgi:hypothetical protein
VQAIFQLLALKVAAVTLVAIGVLVGTGTGTGCYYSTPRPRFRAPLHGGRSRLDALKSPFGSLGFGVPDFEESGEGEERRGQAVVVEAVLTTGLHLPFEGAGAFDAAV